MLTRQEIDAAMQMSNQSKTKAAAILGVHRSTMLAAMKRLGMMATKEARYIGRQFDRPEVPSPLRSVDELIADRKTRFTKKREAELAAALIQVRIRITGPVGILFFGDPHVDDDGTDLQQIEEHTRLVRETPGMFAANVGDNTNNWTGRLAKLYAEQSTSAAEAWQLAEWLFNACPWLFVLGGNHDLWSGSGDPLNWIARQADALYRSSEARIGLRFPNGREVRINARHDFAGSSQWNPAHGQMKAAQMGFRDHLLVSGHKHTSGYGVVKDPLTGVICHCLQVASYKIYDRYAREKGFRDQHISPCACAVIDPDAENEADLITVFWNPATAAEFLTFLRKKRGV
jgi:hypothetical protein